MNCIQYGKYTGDSCFGCKVKIKNCEIKDKVYRNRWIPVSERLPEKYCEDHQLYNFQCVIATLKNGCVCEVWWTGEGFRVADRFKFIELVNNPVIAWQPLPGPYKEASKDAE